MPYIDPNDRDDLEPHSSVEAMLPGELNYQITCLCDGYLAHGLDYQALNDVIGVLECVSKELYRRLAAPYEDHKREINGDVLVTQPPRQAARSIQTRAVGA